MQPFFISGIGTGIGKTFISALLAEALRADYWKPVQAGYEEGTDKETVHSLISNRQTVVHPEVYRLKMPASPHIAAREENILIDPGTDLQTASNHGSGPPTHHRRGRRLAGTPE